MLDLNMATLILVLGVLVFLTNSIVEVIKMAFGVSGAATLNKVALLVAIILTVITYLAYTTYTGISIVWYYLLGSIVLGFIVALIAMLGWDKVLKMWQESQKGEQSWV